MKKLIIAALLVVVALAGCGKKGNEAPVEAVTEKPGKEVEVTELRIESINKLIVSNANLEAKTKLRHGSDADGDLEKVYVKNGDKVKKGQLIAEFSDDATELNYKNAKASYEAAKSQYEKSSKFAEIEMKNNLVAAEAGVINAKESLNRALRGADQEELEQARASVESAKTNYEVTKTTYEKNQKLYQKELIAELDFLNIQNAYKQAESAYTQAKTQLDILLRGTDKEDIAKLEAALKNAEETYDLTKKYIEDKAWKYEIQGMKSQLDSAQANYEFAKSSYDDLTLEAKVSGVISDMNVTVGARFERGDQVCFIVDDSTVEGTVEIGGEDISSVQEGEKLEIFISDLEKTLAARVTEINRVANAVTKKFPVKFEFKNSGDVRDGMYAKVTVEGISKTGFVVPAEAIVVRDLSSYIFVAEGENAKRLRVELGVSEGERQQVSNDELKEGMKVIVKGQHLLDNNDKIKVVE